MPDIKQLDQLVEGALAGMANVDPHVRLDDMLNAAFMLLQRCISVTLQDTDVPPQRIRDGLELLILHSVGPRELKQ